MGMVSSQEFPFYFSDERIVPRTFQQEVFRQENIIGVFVRSVPMKLMFWWDSRVLNPESESIYGNIIYEPTRIPPRVTKRSL